MCNKGNGGEDRFVPFLSLFIFKIYGLALVCIVGLRDCGSGIQCPNTLLRRLRALCCAGGGEGDRHKKVGWAGAFWPRNRCIFFLVSLSLSLLILFTQE